MIELNDLFDYDYKIYQNTEYFKFSVDSILLAEAVKLKSNINILDMCTGNAPVPMILLSKNKDIHIDAVEVQKEIYDLAMKSININGLDEHVTIHNNDIKNIKFDKKFDVITCNPPYFKVNKSSLLNENTVKTIARHEVKVNLDDIVRTAKNNIRENGTFYLVHRTERLVEAFELMKKYSFGMRKLYLFLTKDTEKAEFFILEASKCKKDDLKVYIKNIKDLNTYKGLFEEE